MQINCENRRRSEEAKVAEEEFDIIMKSLQKGSDDQWVLMYDMGGIRPSFLASFFIEKHLHPALLLPYLALPFVDEPPPRH